MKKSWLIIPLFALIYTSCSHGESFDKEKPNVILIMTDDQGIGDFGFMGNPYIKTPTLDSLAANSLNLTNFYVSPVCAPTRASLMTGRYSERTGIYDTYNGGATMASEEVTMAEIFKAKGYKTGIFGKWHLGDNYPYRPVDQGYDISLIHNSGGLGQPGDAMNYFAGDSSYFDPVLFENGKPVKTIGYCSDVFTDGAIDFIANSTSENSEQPFFLYLSFNAPHTPLQLPEEYYDMYKDLVFSSQDFAYLDEAVDNMTEKDIEAAKKVYGMVTNIDDNINRLLNALREKGISENTIIVFLTDNGPEQNRYKLGLKKKKSSVHDGGVRVPCLINYPKMFPEKQTRDIRCAHIDLLPSLLEMCGLPEVSHKIDGLSFMNIDESVDEFTNRTLFFEWGRGYPVKYRNFAAIEGDYKLVGNTGHDAGIDDFQLYNLKTDPGEQKNIIKENHEYANELKNKMDLWYDEIIKEENNNKDFPAWVGTAHENPVILNRNDGKGTPVAWTQEHILNYWDINVAEPGNYDVEYHFIKPITEPGTAILKLYPGHFNLKSTGPGNSIIIENISLNKGKFKLEAYFKTNTNRNIFPLYVSILKK